MSAPVDVLAVMDSAALVLMESGLLDSWEAITRARGEVADLIRAAKAVSESCIANYGDGMGLHLSLAASGGLNERLASALASVRGAA